MTGVSYVFIICNFILIISLSELYYSTFLGYNILYNKNVILATDKNKKLLFNVTNINIYYWVIYIINLLTWKLTFTSSNNIVNLVYFFILFLIFSICISLIYIYRKKHITLITLILIQFILIINCFYFVSNILVLILMLEVIATLYYFFFLNNFLNISKNIIKLKNLLINYLWLSICTLFFCIFSIILMVKSVGTISFSELNYLSTNIEGWVYNLLLIALAWKIGLPLFHFFKLEIYQYLSLLNIFYFSLFSTFLSTYILCFLFLNITDIFILGLNYFIWGAILVNSILIIRGVSAIKFFQFIAFSSLNTITTIVIMLIN